MVLPPTADKMIFDALHPLRVVCGWCGVVMRGGPPQPISHGICPACQQRFEEGAK